MTGCKPSVLCVSRYWGLYRPDRRSPFHPFGESHQEVKNLGLFQVAWCHVGTSMPTGGKEEPAGTGESSPRGSPLR